MLRNFLIITGLSLSACNSGSTSPSNTENTASVLEQAQADHGLVSVPELDGLYSDIPFNEAELYAMNPSAVDNVFSQDPSPDATNELNQIKTGAAKISQTRVQSMRQSSIQSISNSKTHLYCYATAWLNKNGQKLPVSSASLATNSYYVKSWGLTSSSFPNLNKSYVNFDVSIPNEPFDSDFPYIPSHSNHLPYFVKTVNISDLQSLCQTTLQAEIQQYLTSQYPGSSLADVTLQSITIRGRNNSFSDDHPLLPLTSSGVSNKINTIVSLGDSLSDTDATSNFLMWMVPNRTTWFAGHFSNGWTWPEYVAAELNVVAYNEAWGAAGVNPQPVVDSLAVVNNFQLWLGIFFPSLSQQTGYYYNVTSQFPRDPDQTLYSVLIGGNDFVNYAESPDTVLNKVASAVGSLVLTSNAKNIVILNLPDLTKAPAFNGYKANLKNFVAQNTAAYNNSLITLIPSLNLQYPGVKITLFDTNSLFTQVINNPASYGIINVTDTCLQTPDNAYLFHANKVANCDGYNYVFLDNLHPTTKVHQILGQAVADFIKQNYNF